MHKSPGAEKNIMVTGDRDYMKTQTDCPERPTPFNHKTTEQESCSWHQVTGQKKPYSCCTKADISSKLLLPLNGIEKIGSIKANIKVDIVASQSEFTPTPVCSRTFYY